MARLLLIVCLAAGLLAPQLTGAGEFNPQGQFVDRVDDRVTALMAQFPNGGPGLRAAIAFLLTSELDLADVSGSLGQKEAIGLGVADAASYFARCISALCQIAEARLRQAMIFADEPTRTAFVDGTNTNVTDIRPTPPIFIPDVGSSANCMSQASPSGC
jgi:hypothetical protein